MRGRVRIARAGHRERNSGRADCAKAGVVKEFDFLN